MSIRFSFGTLASDQRVGGDLPKDDTPFRVAVLGDFSGRGARGLVGTPEEIGRRRARKVDRGNMDDLIVKSAPTIDVKTGTAPLAFRSLDDFHPDAIHGRVDAFADGLDRDEKTALMNAILHAPAFQTLESAWRGVDWLLQGIAKCGAVEVRLIDLSADELRTDLVSTDRLEETGLYQILVDQPASRGELDPWTVVVGLYLFEPGAADAATLGRIGRIARQASAPFLAGVDPRVLDQTFAPGDDDAEAWESLRQLPESSMLGLAAPRFLLRPPYGEATRTIDAFEFEEYTGPAGWTGYLWGNPALACAVLLARSFAKEGWAFRPGSVLDLGGMVMHVTRDEDDEPVSVLAESRLIRPAAERLSGLGLIPLLCVKGRDAAELACIQSLARPPKGEKASPLLGRWGQKGSVTLPKSGTATSSPAAAYTSHTSVAPPDPASPYTNHPGAAPRPASGVAEHGHEPSPSDEMDPELAALMAELDGGSAAEPDPAAEESVEPEPTPEPAEAEMDPELAALMAELDGGSDPEPKPEAPAEPEMDPELAALMAELEGPPLAAEPAPGSTGDDDLDRLMEGLG